MVIFDVSVLIYAMREGSEHHALAKRAVQEALEAGIGVGWHPSLCAAVVRISTNARLYPDPSTLDECRVFLDDIRNDRDAVLLYEGPGFWEDLVQCLERSGVRGRKVSDAYWATLAQRHNATWITTDKGFSAFSGLRWKNLLA